MGLEVVQTEKLKCIKRRNASAIVIVILFSWKLLIVLRNTPNHSGGGHNNVKRINRKCNLQKIYTQKAWIENSI